ncbi:MAG: anti-sigma factor [Pseudonocardiales bacterium]|nr:anti-sigma factor [Pseudonocardiales bacterium]
MTTPHGTHDPGDLGALALGLLDGDEARVVEQRIGGCATCRRDYAGLRETAAALVSVPPEMFLDGPPESDLLVARAVRRVRAETGTRRRRRTLALVAAAVVAAAALLGGGVVLGRTAAAPSSTSAAGALVLRGTQGAVTMTATVSPAMGWVRVATDVRGIPAGRRCTILVIGRDGSENVAGSWLSSARGEVDGTSVAGSAIVDPAQVLGVVIRDETGTDIITLRA